MTLGLYLSNLSGQLSLATAAIGGIGSYAAAVMTTQLGVPFLLSLPASAIFGMATGLFLALLTYRMKDFILKLVTLAFGEAVLVVAFNIDYLGGANSFTGIVLHTRVEHCVAL